MTRLAFFLSCWVSLVACSLARAADGQIFPKDAKLEQLFTRTAPLKGGLTEGPAAAPDGSIYFTDIPLGDQRGMILRFDPKTKKTDVFVADSGKANGMQFDAAGSLIACQGADTGARAVSRWNIETKQRETVVERYQGKRLNSPNDLTLGPNGWIYFTDPRYAGAESREIDHKGVYRIDPKGAIVEITRESEQPNGIALSPDAKTLYLIDHNSGSDVVDLDAPPPKSGAMKVYSFPLNAEGLVAGPRKTLVDFGAENGCDGMRVDSLGRIFLASRSLKRPGILVVDPSGKELDFLPTGPPNQNDSKEPKGIPSNCEFGIGDASHTLYVTADTGLYRVRVNAEGLPRGRRK